MHSKFITHLPLLLAVVGCAEAVPKELADARSAYDRAAHGPAAELAPADLHTAAATLNHAEQLYEEHGDTQATRDLAYMAERHAQVAEVHARTSAANLKAEELAIQYAQGREQRLGQIQEQLTDRTQQLAEEQAALQAEQARRADAENRARQAMNDLGRIATVKQEERGTVITLSGSVLFASGKSDLRGQAKKRLEEVARALTQSEPNAQIVVQGYTDSTGSMKRNEELSLARAETVRAALISHGVAPDRVRAEGMGPANPIADNDSVEGRANNRRVEIVVGSADQAR